MMGIKTTTTKITSYTRKNNIQLHKGIKYHYLWSRINEDLGNLKSFLFGKLNGIFSDPLNDKSKVGISSLAWWALGEVVFF